MEKIKKFVSEHPQWTSWIVLAIGMVIILVWSARDVGLTPGQWTALIVATILVAGLAVWIIGWEDEEEEEEELVEKPGKQREKKNRLEAKPKGVPGEAVLQSSLKPAGEDVSKEVPAKESTEAAGEETPTEDVPVEEVPVEESNEEVVDDTLA